MDFLDSLEFLDSTEFLNSLEFLDRLEFGMVWFVVVWIGMVFSMYGLVWFGIA